MKRARFVDPVSLRVIAGHDLNRIPTVGRVVHLSDGGVRYRFCVTAVVEQPDATVISVRQQSLLPAF
jgi:hypothetical protein